MSVDTTMAVLYAQSGLSNTANAAMVAPQAAVAISRALAAEAARQERQQVEKSEKADEAFVRGEEGSGKGFFQSRLRTRRRQSESSRDEDALRPKSPIVGNLLNVKV